MTREEHNVRAMLLGLTYIPKREYYTNFNGYRLDAETLLPVTLTEYLRRVDKASVSENRKAAIEAGAK